MAATISKRECRSKLRAGDFDYFLLNSIPSRVKVPTGSSANVLLAQLDGYANWPPLKTMCSSFPPTYPPMPLEPFSLSELRTIYTTGENAILEWLGDAMIAAAVYLCVHRLTKDPDSRALRSEGVTGYMLSAPFLAHIALLYGLQLNDHLPHHCHINVMPSMVRMSDIFEAYVGAGALRWGYEPTLRWLDTLFAPWAAHLSTTETIVAKVTNTVRREYKDWINKDPEGSISPLNPLVVENVSDTEITLASASLPDRRRLLLNGLPTWPTVDLSTVVPPRDYPPLLPPFHSAHVPVLSDAMTDILCRVHFGEETGCNTGYRLVGERLYRLVLTKVAVARLSSATPAELDEARLECANPQLRARLALSLGLHNQVRTLRRDGDESKESSVVCCHALYALASVIYLHLGWDVFVSWFEELLSPWIIAAGDETLRVDPAAESHRQNRLKQQQATQKPPKLSTGSVSQGGKAAKATPRDRYVTLIPKQTRARVPHPGRNIL
ncbi:hypothetical protein FB45DRAFT_1071673 [Roridomyces roridus]|uniref:RNase III domain-containing protein n=1 Tax=Roridomyces roridus TaxID=1738132 RepID=A0AAD7AXJ0_9AGAR|nr:hypothetical protein FB45DRAFT_1071673 [Roridomyces roridus]